jgi:hypothetical protein
MNRIEHHRLVVVYVDTHYDVKSGRRFRLLELFQGGFLRGLQYFLRKI